MEERLSDFAMHSIIISLFFSALAATAAVGKGYPALIILCIWCSLQLDTTEPGNQMGSPTETDPIPAQGNCFWSGTAPFCAGSCDNATHWECATSSCGDGACCWTGTKRHCCHKSASPSGCPTSGSTTIIF
ncbi:unnamed protein product [Aspergillus oryzae]|uniref:Unnamed protein product n=2 Tax=Aspergillus oryzae TaxID=5062 RepID=A0AAN5BR59_ASPOZ|nr:unnamed protein product [Aspergillus oryzae]GMF88107.1 unnamed protein product [Aspergillus oryzae]GMG05247.1 unnamed protein product [Aspergillus oryzae]GMG28501.1 unnamed protein product [Aspergillus oryzae]GMG54121.1 unnamed protein product [Aspergillus oryzae var. brunneus]